ncbi:50S ribosomal protein L4 [Candidiatus Paracoxiella cheracis]|uniref:50S ribosomal protein L4 n=1 Tax=Candidiatus Paracoxiella cheracis TaxID=3405120 RepID=UPI003BF57BCC
MELQVQGKDKIKVSDKTFGCEFKEGLIHQIVTAYLAGGRAGTKAQKTRSDVSGGGTKPWRQKGTGRARAGTIRSPLWRSGGVTFAARPRDYSQKVNKKMYQRALASILSELVRQDRLVIIDDLKLKGPKTQELVKALQKLKIEKGLIILDNEDRNINLASRNIPHVDVCDAVRVDPVSLVAAEKVVITVAAIKKLEERLS